MILDQPWQIELYRLHILKHRLTLEIRGFAFKRGTMTTLQAVNDTLIRNNWMEHPFRSKRGALEALETYIAHKEKEAMG